MYFTFSLNQQAFALPPAVQGVEYDEVFSALHRKKESMTGHSYGRSVAFLQA